MADLREQIQQDLGSAYTLEQELGGGGMSRVFVATENALGRKVVIKILPPEMAAAVSSQRFRREIQLAANLQHPHIVPLHSAGELNGLPYFTMPYVKGESLRAHLMKVGELPLSEAIRILREVASALAYAHENGVVHRDIKPENVLISGGSAVVTDFGVAKALSASSGDTGSSGPSLTSMGVALGTPAYMAPEQATADPHTDHRADIYALGVMAYEMITGSTPFSGRSPQATLAAHVTEVPENVTKRRSNIPPGLGAIVMRSLEKRPADRYQSAQDVVHDLDALTTPSGGMMPTASHRSVKKPGWIIPAAAGILFLVAGAVGYKSLLSRGASESQAVAGKEVHSLAVLPFANMSGDPANEYFSDGLADQLLNELAEIPGLRVAARTSSFQFKGKTEDIREVGARLGVLTVLEGSVRKSGDRMRITAQLVDAKTGYHLWSETFDRTVTDVFAVQDEITKAIRDALQIRLGSAEISEIASARPENTEAYNLYLKGLYASNLRTEKGLHEAIEYYKEAVAIDSTYALASAALGAAYISLTSLNFAPASKGIDLAKPWIDRALRIDPESPQVQLAYAQWLLLMGKLDEAEPIIQKALARNPNLSVAHAGYSTLLRMRGDAEKALSEALIARDLDPMSPARSNAVATSQVVAGRPQEAIKTYRSMLVQTPDNPTVLMALGGVLAQEGQYAEAIALTEKALAAAPDDPTIKLALAYAFAKAGQREKAMDIIRAMEALPNVDQYFFDIAAPFIALGEKDSAFAWLEKAPNATGIYVKLEPVFNPLRSDPRFAKLMKKWGVK